MDADLKAALHELRARTEIPQLIYAYALGVTEGDPDLQASGFAPDADLEFSFKTVHGFDEIRAFFGGESSKGSGVNLDERTASTPLVSNILITVDGDTAHSECTAIVCHDGFRDGKQVTVIRGVRYSDDFVLLDAGWKIKKRVHTTKWGTEIVRETGG
jgi:hypothetical protein